MLHGFADTGDMWAPLAAELAKDHTVIVPDLRGMGLSSHPEGGYDKKTQAGDVAQRARPPRASRRPISSPTTSATWSATPSPRNTPSASRAGCAMDAPLPGIGTWDEIVQQPPALALQFPRAGRRASGRRAASASISTASGTNCRPIRHRSTKRPAGTTPSFTRCPAPCIRPSSSSRPFIRMRSTTRPWRQRASSP